MIKPAIFVVSTLLASPALAQPNYFASPRGTANDVCSQAQPCTPQAAFQACSEATVPGDTCHIQLADGDYYDPGINVFYYRRADFIGNCDNPSSVRLIGTKPGTALIWVQDHAIGRFECIRLEGYTGNITGISGRQHVIVDYFRIVFGNMPGGTHVLMNEFSIASCVDVVEIAGDAAIHVGAFKNSAINLPCTIDTNGVFSIDFFATAQAFSTIDARSAQFTGSYRVFGVDCAQATGIVFKPQNGRSFPGTTAGNCP